MSNDKKITEICDFLRLKSNELWDVDECMDPEHIAASPLSIVVAGYGDPITSIHSYRRLAWLVMFAARRSLPCWNLYCDGDVPSRAVSCLAEWLANGEHGSDLNKFTIRAIPSYRGEHIVDCRSCDTGCVAQAASSAVRFAISRRSIDAIVAISHADMAFSQSPLCEKDHFRKWLIEIAIPYSWVGVELSTEQQNAFRTYAPSEITRSGN